MQGLMPSTKNTNTQHQKINITGKPKANLHKSQQQPNSNVTTMFLPKAFTGTLDSTDIMALYRKFNPVSCDPHLDKNGHLVGSGLIKVPAEMVEACVNRWEHEYWRAKFLVPVRCQAYQYPLEIIDLYITGLPTDAALDLLDLTLQREFQCSCRHFYFDENRKFNGTLRTSVPHKFAQQLFEDPVYRSHGKMYNITVRQIVH